MPVADRNTPGDSPLAKPEVRARRPFFRTTYRQIRIRPRLGISVLIYVVIFLLSAHEPRLSTRILFAWDIAIGLYILLALVMMARADMGCIRAKAKEQDDGAVAVLILTILAALASVAAIGFELHDLKNYAGHDQGMHFVLAGFTLVTSWALIHISFALHYAHVYYLALDASGGKPTLEFAHEKEPDYVDFLYFSFVIGTTSQTADVNIASREMRRLALMHGVLAFFFNTSLLALTVNIAASQL